MEMPALTTLDLKRAVYAALRDLRGEDCDTIWWHTRNYLRDRGLCTEDAMPTSDEVYRCLQVLCSEKRIRKYATYRSARPIAYARLIVS